jgi:peptide deformylase
MEDLTIHPSVAEMWRCLFDKDEQTPLQKLLVTVNAGHTILKKKKEQMSKKEFCLSLDNNCSNIEIQRKKKTKSAKL